MTAGTPHSAAESDQPLQRPGSTVRCGTASGYRLHQHHDEKPCEACTRAKQEYDERWRSAPERTRVSRLHAKAQSRALRRLKDANLAEYHRLYAEEKAKVYAEADMSTRPGVSGSEVSA